MVRVWGSPRRLLYGAGPAVVVGWAARLELEKSRWEGGGGNGPPPGRPLERAVPVPCLGPRVRPKHGSLLRAMLARARWPSGRAGLGLGQKNGAVPGQRARAGRGGNKLL